MKIPNDFIPFFIIFNLISKYTYSFDWVHTFIYIEIFLFILFIFY